MKTFAAAALLASSVVAQNLNDSIPSSIQLADGTYVVLTSHTKTYWSKVAGQDDGSELIEWGLQLSLTDAVLPAGSSLTEREAYFYVQSQSSGLWDFLLFARTIDTTGGTPHNKLTYLLYEVSTEPVISGNQRPASVFALESPIAHQTWTDSSGFGEATTIVDGGSFDLLSNSYCTGATAGTSCTFVLRNKDPVTDPKEIANIEANGISFQVAWGVSGKWDANTADSTAAVTGTNSVSASATWAAAGSAVSTPITPASNANAIANAGTATSTATGTGTVTDTDTDTDTGTGSTDSGMYLAANIGPIVAALASLAI